MLKTWILETRYYANHNVNAILVSDMLSSPEQIWAKEYLCVSEWPQHSLMQFDSKMVILYLDHEERARQEAQTSSPSASLVLRWTFTGYLSVLHKNQMSQCSWKCFLKEEISYRCNGLLSLLWMEALVCSRFLGIASGMNNYREGHITGVLARSEARQPEKSSCGVWFLCQSRMHLQPTGQT